MISLLAPQWLYLLLLPILIGVIYYFWSKRQLSRYCDPALQKFMLIEGWSWRSLPWLWLSIWSLLVLALAEPIWLSDDQLSQQTPMEWVAVVDLSDSMLADDISPSRLQATSWALESIGQDWRKGDKSGLWVFAGSAHRLIPQTEDLALWQSGISLLRPELMPIKGSLLIDALQKISAQVSPETVIVVFSDGSDQLDVTQMTAKLPQKGILVSVGRAQGLYPVNQQEIRKLAHYLGWETLSLNDQGIANLQVLLRQYRISDSKLSSATSGQSLQPWLLVLTLLLWFGFGRWK